MTEKNMKLLMKSKRSFKIIRDVLFKSYVQE